MSFYLSNSNALEDSPFLSSLTSIQWKPFSLHPAISQESCNVIFLMKWQEIKLGQRKKFTAMSFGRERISVSFSLLHSRWLDEEQKKNCFSFQVMVSMRQAFSSREISAESLFFVLVIFFSIIASGASGARGRENKAQSHGDEIRALIRLEANETIFVLVSSNNMRLPQPIKT